MKKQHLIFTLALLLTTITLAQGQTQKGFVKTRGRMDAQGNHIPGQGLKGATVSIKGRTAVLVQSDDGAFSFPIPDKQFCVDSVKKKSYELVDADFCYKTYDYSTRPIDILMEVPGKQMEDYMEDFERINASQQAMISQLRAEVKQLKAQNKINEEEYSRRLADIAEMQSESQKLVSEMAERYSKMDFDRLDDFNRQVGWLILNGDLIKADSLIKSKGSMAERSAELDQLHQANTKVRVDLEKSEQVEAIKLEDFATDCYNLYEICKLKYENDSAAYWLELRASKDTTNIEWQLEAGKFIDDYLADYDKALSYYSLALRQALQQQGEQCEWTATCYNNIGMVYGEQGDYDKALEYYGKALTIRKVVLGENHPDVALSYDNIGAVYAKQGDYDKALEYLENALIIHKAVLGENHPNVALSYNNIGAVYNIQGSHDKALEYFEKALTIWKAILGENHPNVASSYNNIGSVYCDQGDYDKALEYHEKALAIRKAILWENHPDMALSCDNIGDVYNKQGDYNKALEYHGKALTLYKAVLGEKHPYVAISYNNIGTVYDNQGDHGKALEYYGKALNIFKAFLGENHPNVAISYGNIGSVYSSQGDYDKALEYLETALNIFKAALGENHPNVAISYNNIGTVYNDQGDYDKALEYYEKALTIFKSVLGEDHPNTKTTEAKIESIKQEINK